MATPTDGPTSTSLVSCVPRSCPNFNVDTSGSGGGIIVENAKVTNANKLYLRQISNQSSTTGVINCDWGLYDGLGSTAKLLAKAHGMHAHAGNCFTLLFVDQRFKGSTLQVMGANDDNEQNEWAIVGGTGEFAMARGIINTRLHSCTGNTITQQLTIEFFCRMKEVPIPPAPPKIPARAKRGPWGGNGGSLKDMEGKSQRLESLTIYHHGVVEGFQFSYTDEDDQIRTTGIWGQNRNLWKIEIKFGPSEYVKQVSGAGSKTNPSYLCQLKIVTNNTTYGPYGFWEGTPFSSTVPENETVVGFFGSNDNPGNNWVTTIGVYTISK